MLRSFTVANHLQRHGARNNLLAAVSYRTSSLSSHAAASEDISRRKQFKETPVHNSILQYIKAVGIGIPGRIDHRRKRKRELPSPDRRSNRTIRGNDESEGFNSGSQIVSWIPPAPFGKFSSPIKVVGSVGFEDESEEFPKNNALIPEVALAGRSNVGKSTLLNALLYGNKDSSLQVRRIERRRRGATPDSVKLPKGVKAAMSPKPGETRQINFFRLQSIEPRGSEVETRKIMLVDMPGFGFAYAKEEHSRGFRKLVSRYLLTRGRPLKRVLLLLDARHGMKVADIEFLTMLQNELAELNKNTTNTRKPRLPAIQLVLTKCDLVKQVDLARRVAMVRQQLSDCFRREPTAQLPIMMVSARAGVGYNNVGRQFEAKGGVYELQKELANLTTARRSTATKQSKDRAKTLRQKAEQAKYDAENGTGLEPKRKLSAPKVKVTTRRGLPPRGAAKKNNFDSKRTREEPPKRFHKEDADECLVPFG